MRLFFTILFVPVCFCLCAQQTALLAGEDSVFNAVRELREVVVTAEKRELNPRDIPSALTVIGPQSFPGENSPDLRNISGIVPNFYIQEGGLKLSTPLYVRGIGTTSGTPSVGLYVDGVPVFDKNAFIFDLGDLQQIEILRGPQTTLYGRNSINGLIQITTRLPSKDFSLQVRSGYSSYASQNYRITANLPFRAVYSRISYACDKSRGYFKNRCDNGRKSNPSDSHAVRYRGIAYAGRNWKIAFGANYDNSFDGGYAYHAVDSLKQDRYTVSYNTPSSYERSLFSAYANLKKNWKHMLFSTVSSYSHTRDKQILDADFTYLDVFDNNKKSHQNLVTEEIDFRSLQGKRLDWTTGIFGFYKDLTNTYVATFGKDKAYLLPVPLDKARYCNHTVTWGLAGYGQINLKELWPGMSLTAGVRYDYEKSRLTYEDSVRFSQSPRYRQFHSSAEDIAFRAWLPKFSLLQQWNGRLSLYLSISKGYKAGGYNVIANEMSSKTVKLDYDEEKLWNYETGLKYSGRDRKFSLNAAVFFIDWKDQQIFVMGMMGPGIENAGDARSYGGETELHWEFLPGWACLLSAGYSHSRYCRNLEKSYEGNHIAMAPEFTGNAGISYRKSFGSSLIRNFSASTNLNGFGTQYFDEANRLKQSPYFLWNMELSLSGKHFGVRLWGKNILDKSFFAYMLNNPVGGKLPQYRDMGQSGAPARFGASVTLNI